MRGHHAHYIGEVNAMSEPWYVKIGRNKWRTTRDLIEDRPHGKSMIPAGTVWDMFSCVPNTGYIEFHKASLWHDVERKFIEREQADYNFLVDMMKRIATIRDCLLATDCEREVIDVEIVRLSRIAALYEIGVSGKIGSIYIWLDKVL